MTRLTVSLTESEKKWGFTYLILQMFILPNVLGLLNALLPRPLSEITMNILFFSLNFVCVMTIFHRFLWKNLPKSGHQWWICLRYAFLGLFFYTVFNHLLDLFILWVQPDFSNVNDDNIAQMVQQSFFLLSFSTVFLVPITEECLFRGVLFSVPHKKSRLWGYTISVLVFALVHVIGYVDLYGSPLLFLCFLQYLPAGLCLCWAYEKSNTIFAPILMHMTINQMGILAMR